MIKVWHAVKPTFGLTAQSFPADYELVAEVDTDDLDVAFERTNTIHGPWWENESVLAIKQTRSTSVGDVLEVGDKHYKCEPIGWTELKLY